MIDEVVQQPALGSLWAHRQGIVTEMAAKVRDAPEGAMFGELPSENNPASPASKTSRAVAVGPSSMPRHKSAISRVLQSRCSLRNHRRHSMTNAPPIRLTAVRCNDRCAFILSQEGRQLYSTSDPTEMAEKMLRLWIDNPDHLVKAARQWGVVEIWQEANPDWWDGWKPGLL